MSFSKIEITIIVSSLLILLLICGVVITMFIANKKHVMHEVKIAKMEVEYEKELRIAEQQVQERVLAHVARDLHDNIGQRLTVLKFLVDGYKRKHPESVGEIEPILTDVADVIKELRMISRSLNSDLFETGGMLEAMKDEVARLRMLNTIKVNWDDDGEPDLQKDQRVMMFRVFQEILNNTLKHAQCNNINIRIKSKPFGLFITDDGVGFDIDAIKALGKGSGLENMLKRASLAKVKGEITSKPGAGTKYTFEQEV